MHTKCPKCGNKISTEWLVYSSANEKYRCVGCGVLIEWSDKYKKHINWVIWTLILAIIFGKQTALEKGLFVDVNFGQDIFVMLGIVFFILHLKFILPLKRFIKPIDTYGQN